MRHRVKGRKLGRSTPHRKATLRALSSALIREHRIETTLPKAKELRAFIEPLITRAKVDSTHNRRIIFSNLQDKRAVTELFETVGPAAADRPGGYTRVLKLGFRVGDAAEMAVIELVDFNDVPPESKDAKKKKTRRAGKSVKTDSTAADSSEKKTKSKESDDIKTEETEAATAKDVETSVKEEGVTETDEVKEKAEETTATTEAKADPKAKEKENKKESDEDIAAKQEASESDEEKEDKK